MSYHVSEGLIPTVRPAAFVHPSAVLIGDVIVGVGTYIDPLVSPRGDREWLIVQAEISIQDGCTMYGYCDTDTIVGENNHIGHEAILHGCVIGHDALAGMNSAIMDGAVIDEKNIVAAMSFVKAGLHDEKHQLLMSTPACVVRSANDDELHWKWLNTREYQGLIGRCHASLHETQPPRQMEENHPHLQGTTDATPKR